MSLVIEKTEVLRVELMQGEGRTLESIPYAEGEIEEALSKFFKSQYGTLCFYSAQGTVSLPRRLIEHAIITIIPCKGEEE